MKRYSDNSRMQRFLVVVGCLLIVAGIIGLLNEYLLVEWWRIIVDQARRVCHAAIPIALIVLGAYLMWTSRKGVLGNVVHPKIKASVSRSRNDRRIFGVCGGFARSRSIDSIYVRIAVLLLFVAFPAPVLFLYMLLALVFPLE